MNIISAIETALSRSSEVLAERTGIQTEELFRRTEAFIRSNSEKWRNPIPSIDYSSPFCRLAYLYMNVAIHAHLAERALSSYPELESLFRQRVASGSEISICAIGGGPGSELLGVASFIESLAINRPAYLDFLLVDQTKEWDETWHVLKRSIDAQYQHRFGPDRNLWPAVVSRSFLPLNAISADDFSSFSIRFSGIDLFFFSYVVSEMKHAKPQLQSVIDFLAMRANEGAIFVFIDRDESDVRHVVEGIVRESAELLMGSVIRDRGRYDFTLSDFGEWFVHIEPIPRQKWLAFFALARKS